MTGLLIVFLASATPAKAAVDCVAPIGKREVPCRPSASEQTELMEKIRKALKLREDFGSAAVEEDFVRNSDPGDWQRLVDWKNKRENREAAESSMRDYFREVLQMVQETYGVRPAANSNSIAGGAMEGVFATWNPIIQEGADLVFRSSRAKGPDFYLKFDNYAGDFATTFDDGTVIISYRTLERCIETESPAFLAATLAHEAVHFNSLIGKGWSSHAANQLNAYIEEARVGTLIGLNEDDLNGAREKRNSYQYRVNEEQRLGQYSSAYQTQDLSDAYKAEFAEIQEKLRGISAKRDELAAGFEREANERMRRLQDSVNDPVPPAVPPVLPPPATPAELPRPVQPVFVPQWTINALAAAGCLDPRAKSQEELDSDWSRLRGTAYRPDWAESMTLSGCQRVLFLRLLSMASAGTPERLTRDTFAVIATEARSPAPTAEDVPEAVRGTQPPDRPRCRFMGDWCGANSPPKN